MDMRSRHSPEAGMKANIALACVEAASTRAEPERRSRAPAMSASTALELQHWLRPVTIGMMKNQHHDDRRKAEIALDLRNRIGDRCPIDVVDDANRKQKEYDEPAEAARTHSAFLRCLRIGQGRSQLRDGQLRCSTAAVSARTRRHRSASSTTDSPSE